MALATLNSSIKAWRQDKYPTGLCLSSGSEKRVHTAVIPITGLPNNKKM